MLTSAGRKSSQGWERDDDPTAWPNLRPKSFSWSITGLHSRTPSRLMFSRACSHLTEYSYAI